jgi:hypothetical protein
MAALVQRESEATMTTLDTLAGAADADNFRMTVDWGRWYIDPLPGCDIAPATEARWPSISAVKKASEKDWSFLTVARIAALPGDEYARLAKLSPTQRGDAIRSHEKHLKQISYGRGTIIHLWAEDLLAGRPPREITADWLARNGYPVEALEEAKLYLPALLDFFDTYQPEPVAVEFVTIHRSLNGYGYGGTPDALVRMQGEVVGIDWKSRTGDKPTAYPEELAQIAAGARAEYMVVNDGGQSRRQKLPDIAGGYVVSIHTNGARLYPLDLDKGWQHWCNLHEWWVARLTEKDGIGRVKPFKTSGKKAPTLDRDALRARYRALPEVDQDYFQQLNIPADDLRAIAAALNELENRPTMLAQAAERMASEPAKPVAEADDEGGDVDIDDELRVMAAFLTDEARAWVGAITSGPITQGKPIRYTHRKVRRRADIAVALAKWAALGYHDDAFRAALHAVTDDPTTFWPTLTLQDILATFDATQAAWLKNFVDAIGDDKYALIACDDGTYRWKHR